MEIHPPIPERTTEQLLEIIETTDQWQTGVVQLARNELAKRGISAKVQETRKKNYATYHRRREAIKSRATYTTPEKILMVLFGPILAILFHDLFVFYAGEGYRKKNVQGIFYMALGIMVWVLVLSFAV